MISHDPATRPSAAEVMAELIANESAGTSQQKTEDSMSGHSTSDSVSQLLLVIEALKKEIAEKNLIIQQLTSNDVSSVKIQIPENVGTL